MCSYVSLDNREAETVIGFVRDCISDRDSDYSCPNDNYSGQLKSLYDGIRQQGLVCMPTNKGIRVYNALENRIIRALLNRGYKFSSPKIDLVNLEASIILYSKYELVNNVNGLSITKIMDGKYKIATVRSDLQCLTNFVNLLENLEYNNLGVSKVF